MNLKVLLIVQIFSCIIAYLLAFWQLEMIWLAHYTPAQYYVWDFAGFGDLGLNLWTWRDIFWLLQTLCLIFIAVGAFLLGWEIKET